MCGEQTEMCVTFYCSFTPTTRCFPELARYGGTASMSNDEVQTNVTCFST